MTTEINLNNQLKKRTKYAGFFVPLHPKIFPNTHALKKQVKHLALLFIRGSFLRRWFWPVPKNYAPFHTSPIQLPFGHSFKHIAQLFFTHAHATNTLTFTNIPTTVSLNSIEYIGNMFGFHKNEGPTFTNKKVQTSHHPLVSILIPAHHHRYLLKALQSAQAQTYKNIEIIVSDDSSTDEINRMIDHLDDPSIHYTRCPQKNNGAENHIHLIKSCRGEYIKFLNDDDILHKTCVETMIHTLQKHPTIGLITSTRSFVDSDLNHLYDYELLKSNAIIERSYMIKLLYLYGNIIGEPTTALFKKELIQNQHYPNIFKIFNHYKFDGLPGDIRLWLSILLQSDIIYLNKSLSSFRQHANQYQKNTRYMNHVSTGHRVFQKIIEDLGLINVKGKKNVILPLSMDEFKRCKLNPANIK